MLTDKEMKSILATSVGVAIGLTLIQIFQGARLIIAIGLFIIILIIALIVSFLAALIFTKIKSNYKPSRDKLIRKNN